MVTIGLIGGSGLLKTKLPALQGLAEEQVDTAHGRVFLRAGTIAPGVTLVFVQRHDAKPSRVYTQPADINYAAIALALKAKGCDFAVAICSVGSLRASLPVGSLLVCDDFWCAHDLRRVYADARAHFMPGFSEPVRAAILDIVRGAGYHPSPSGVYVNAQGPRFETKAEIRHMATVGDVVGMTAAHEVSACAEVGLPYALLACVDNFANGLGPGNLTVDDFHRAQAENLAVVERCVAALLEKLPGRAELAAAASAPAPAASPSSSSTSSAGAHPAGPAPVDLLVHARWVVPVAPGREGDVLDHHSLAVAGGKIVDVLPTADAARKYAAARVVTLSGKHVVMPGLVNAHTHLPLNLLKGVGDDMPLLQWLTEQIWPTEGRLMSPEYVRAGTRAAVAECIKGGVTCINDMYFYPGETAKVLEETGLRGQVSVVALEFPMGAYAANAGEFLARGLEAREACLARGAGGGRVTWALGPHAPYTVSDATFERVRELSAGLGGAKINLHLHETAGEVACSCAGTAGPSKHMSAELCSPVANMKRLGLLSERMIAVHMTCLTDAEVADVAASGTHVVHCPHSNLKLASGFCPVAKLLAAGVNVALGTDSASSNNALDMWAEMKTAALLAKAVASDATALPAWQALRMATYNGAVAVAGGPGGAPPPFGCLAPGKLADFIAVELDAGAPETGPVYNVLSHLVYASQRGQVSDVWVGGAQLLAGRALTTIDEAALAAEIREWAEKVRPGATAEDKHAKA